MEKTFLHCLQHLNLTLFIILSILFLCFMGVIVYAAFHPS